MHTQVNSSRRTYYIVRSFGERMIMCAQLNNRSENNVTRTLRRIGAERSKLMSS